MSTSVQPSARAAAFAPAAVFLSLFIGLAQVRMDEPWSRGVLFLVALVPAVFVLALALGASAGDNAPRGAATVLVIAGLALTGIAVVRFGQVLAGNDWSDHGGTLTLVLALFTAIAAYWYRETRSVAALLIASLASVGLLLEAVNWIFSTDDADVIRALLTFAFVVLFVAGLSVPGRPGTVLVGAAGVTVIASGYALGLVFALSFGGPDSAWGWELVTLLEGLALLGYAAVELEPGPGYLAFFALVFFITAAASGGGTAFGGDGEASHSLVGWPLALGIAAAAAGVWGARGTPAG
jgi:hypothetical protein